MKREKALILFIIGTLASIYIYISYFGPPETSYFEFLYLYNNKLYVMIILILYVVLVLGVFLSMIPIRKRLKVKVKTRKSSNKISAFFAILALFLNIVMMSVIPSSDISNNNINLFYTGATILLLILSVLFSELYNDYTDTRKDESISAKILMYIVLVLVSMLLVGTFRLDNGAISTILFLQVSKSIYRIFYAKLDLAGLPIEEND